MELQIKTAAQMRDQGHALKQKALDLVAEAERKVPPATPVDSTFWRLENISCRDYLDVVCRATCCTAFFD